MVSVPREAKALRIIAKAGMEQARNEPDPQAGCDAANGLAEGVGEGVATAAGGHRPNRSG